MGQRLGQHFLKDKKALRDVADALAIEKDDVVIEVGPGHGELTQYLLESGARVIAIEKDCELASGLVACISKLVSRIENLEVIEGDVLKVLPTLYTKYLSVIDLPKRGKLQDTSYKLVGNIPYYITGHLLRIIGDLEHRPQRAVFTIQKEVAQRVSVKKGAMNLLAACMQIWARPKIVRTIPAGSFSPPPKVDSAVLMLDRHGQLEDEGIDYRIYCLFARVLFKQPRKTIFNNLIAGGFNSDQIMQVLEKVGVSPSDRPAKLDVDEIVHMFRCFQ